MATDLRNGYDEKTDVVGGTLYRKGAVVQVWWHNTPCGFVGPETWELADTQWGEDQAKKNFREMAELWNSPENSLAK